VLRGARGSDVVTIARPAAASGQRVTLDPHIRPALLLNTDVGRCVEEVGTIASVVRLSDEDAAHVYPGLPP